MSTDNDTAFTLKPNQPTSEILDNGILSDSDNEFLAELAQALATENPNGADAPTPDQPITDCQEPMTNLDVATPSTKFHLIWLKIASLFRKSLVTYQLFRDTWLAKIKNWLVTVQLIAGEPQNKESEKDVPIDVIDQPPREEYQSDLTKKLFSDNTITPAVHEAEQHKLSANPYFHISEDGFTIPIQRPMGTAPVIPITTNVTPQTSAPPHSNIPTKLDQKPVLHHKPPNSINETHREEHHFHFTEIWGTIALWSAFFCIVVFAIAIWYSNDMADRTLRLETANKDLNSKIDELLKRVDLITQALVSAEQRIKQVDQRLGHQIFLFTKYTAKRSDAIPSEEVSRTLRNNQRQRANPQLEIIVPPDETTEDRPEDRSTNRTRRGRRNPR